MLYDMRATSTTTAPPRVVDAHSLLHLRASKGGEGLRCGRPRRRPRRVAEPDTAGSGHRLRAQCRVGGPRPAVNPGAAAGRAARGAAAGLAARSVGYTGAGSVTVPPVSPVVMDVRERLNEIVNEIGLNATLGLLAASEKVAA